MSVRRFDNSLRYFVKSDSRKAEHLVELDAYNCNGKCTCEDFRIRREPKLEQRAKPCDGLRCKHIAQARAFLTDDIIKRMASMQNGKTNEQKAEKTARQKERARARRAKAH